MKKLTDKDVTFKVFIDPEEASIRGNASAISPEVDKQTEEYIRRELANGNEWAWCMVTVVACWKLRRGYSSLGCCSYKSEGEFREDAYFSDMKTEALANLNKEIEQLAEELDELQD